MAFIHEPPLSLGLAMLCFLIAVGAACRGVHLLVRGLRQASQPTGALWVARGLRGVIVAVGAASLGGGVLLASKGLLVFGVIFLAEELYETSVVLLALRAGLKAASQRASLA